jgi:hypothetical protein
MTNKILINTCYRSRLRRLLTNRLAVFPSFVVPLPGFGTSTMTTTLPGFGTSTMTTTRLPSVFSWSLFPHFKFSFGTCTSNFPFSISSLCDICSKHSKKRIRLCDDDRPNVYVLESDTFFDAIA